MGQAHTAVLRNTILPALVFLFLVYPVSAQQSYRTQEASKPRAASHRTTTLDSANKSDTPQSLRFLGWQDAAKRGPDVLQHFLSIAQRRRQNLQSQTALPEPFLPNVSLSAANLPGIAIRPSLPAGLIPTAVATGDFNGDGKLDWVVANGGDSTVNVYLGNGDGTAKLPAIINLTGEAPVSIAVADMNADGNLDIVVAEIDTATIGILYGNGDGTFQPEILVGILSVIPTVIGVGDVNRDGRPDIIVGVEGQTNGEAAPGGFFVLLNSGKGKGIFTVGPFAPSGVETFPNVTAMAVADVNGDGIPDVVAVEDSPEQVQVYLGNGDGTFNGGQFISNSGIVNNVVIGDLNGDHCPDVVTGDSFSQATIYYGNCSGTFDNSKNAPIYEMGDIVFGLAVADLNGDGHLDLITGGVTHLLDPTGIGLGNSIGVRLNDGTGHFGTLQVYRGVPEIFALAASDLAGNGRSFVISANQDFNSITVFQNDGSGGFGEPSGGFDGTENGTIIGPQNSPASPVLVTDVNGDGIQDLTLLEFPDTTTPLFQATIMLGLGSGKFAAPVRTPVLPAGNFVNISDFIFADFRNSGLQDFVGMSYDDSGNCLQPTLVYAQNLGNGKLGAPTKLPFPIGNACFVLSVMAVADFNHDGKMDLAIASPTGTVSGEWQLTIYLGNGDGTFVQKSQLNVPPPPQGAGIPEAMFVEDANKDGKLDIMVWLASNGFGSGISGKDLYEVLGNGDGTFQTPKNVLQNLDQMTMNDLNHDGLLDVIQVETAGQRGISPLVLSVYLAKPDGTFGPPTTIQPYNATYDIFFGDNVTAFGQGSYFGDFNGDGNLDVAVFQFNSNSIPPFVQFLAGNGDGTFTKTFDVFPIYTEFTPDTIIPNAFGDGRTSFLQTPNYSASYQVIQSIAAPIVQAQFAETPSVLGQDAVRINLNALSSSDTTVNLTASDAGIQISPTVIIPAGSLSLTVPFSIVGNFPRNQWFSIAAESGGTTSTAYDYQEPIGFGIPFAFSVQTTSGIPGESFTTVPTPGQTSFWSTTIESFGVASSTFQVSCSNLPVGLSCSNFSPTSFIIPPAGSSGSTFGIPVPVNIAPGLYPFTVTATDGFVTMTSNPTLAVSDFGLSVLPATQTVLPTSTATLNLTITGQFGFNQQLSVSCSGLPVGGSCQAQGEYTVGVGATVGLLFNNATPGTYTITVTGTNGVTSHTATTQVVINAEPAITVNSNLITVAAALVGSPSTQTFQVTNSGTAPLNIQSIALNAQEGSAGVFAESDTCKTAVAPGNSCTSTITFTPSAVGRASAAVLITSNVPGAAPNIPILASGVDFSVAAPTVAPISPGQTANFLIPFTANQFTGTLTVTCAGAIPEGQCVAPGPVQISSNAPVNIQVGVTTTAPSNVIPRIRAPKFAPPIRVLIVLATLLLIAAGFRFVNGSNDGRARRVRSVAALAVLSISLATLAGCGGGGTASAPVNPVQHDAGTPAGTYRFTVTFSGAGGSRTVQLTVNVT